MDPFSYAAEVCGKFVGAVIGTVLKVAGPQLEEFLFNVATRVLDSRAEFSGKNKTLDEEFDKPSGT